MRKTIVVLLVLCAKIAQAQIYIDSYRFAGAAPELPIVSTNLLAYYDASNSTSYPGSGSTWFDLSGNNRNLTISGATYNATNGGVFDFDGVADYMEYTNTINENIKSFSIWFNSNINFNNGIRGTLLDFSDLNTYQLVVNLGNITGVSNFEDISFVSSLSTFQASYLVSAPSQENTWYNLTINYNGSDYDFYINNVFYSKTTIGGDPHVTLKNIEKLGLGKRFFSNNSFFNGKIGEFFIYNEALTAQQLTDNYNATKTRYGY